MMNRNSYILVLSVTTAINMAATAQAESQFLPEAKEKFSDFSNSNSTIYSPILECRENGYTISSCPEGSMPSKPCPYGISTGLYKECVPAASICLNKGYVLNCEEGYEADYAQRCPEDELYTKCKCNTCVGYYYSEEEANAEGYIADGEPCLSCNEKKYKRIENPCDGFEYDTTNCGVNSCGTLEGDTCQSGAVLKYKNCAPCPTPACPEGTVNYDTYFCNGALRCYWPAEEVQCKQTTCFDYTYSESVTCKPGYVKKSCTDPCVGTRYKCEESAGNKCVTEGYTKQTPAFSSDKWKQCPYDSGYYKYECGNTITNISELNYVLQGKCSDRDSGPTYKLTSSLSGNFQTCTGNCGFPLNIDLQGNKLDGNLDFKLMDGSVSLSNGIVTNIISPKSSTLSLKGITGDSVKANTNLVMDGCAIKGSVTSRKNAQISNSSLTTTGCELIYLSGEIYLLNTNLTSTSSYCGYQKGLIQPTEDSVINITGGSISCKNNVLDTKYFGYRHGITINIAASNLTYGKYKEGNVTLACPK